MSKATTKTDRQLPLPLTLHETREARLRRILSGQLRDKVKLASAMTFTAETAAEAEATAQRENQQHVR